MDTLMLRLRCDQIPIRRSAFVSAAAVLLGVVSGTPPTLSADELWQEPAAAYASSDQSMQRGTLFRWGIDDDAEGGPNLEEPLATDRPDFTEASVTVGRGVAQIETGYTYFYDSEDGVSERTQSFGEPLLRYGIFADWLELRVALFPVQQRIRSNGESNTTAGTEDLYLGMKFALTPQEKWLPEMAIVPQMTVPTGSNNFTSDETLPGVNWLYGWDINDKLSTGGSTQVNRSIDETGIDYAEWAQSWTVGYSLAENVGAYAEWFAIIPNDADTALTEHYFDCGLTYLVNNDVQLDVRAGWGLNDAAQDFFVGTGLSIRFQ